MEGFSETGVKVFIRSVLFKDRSDRHLIEHRRAPSDLSSFPQEAHMKAPVAWESFEVKEVEIFGTAVQHFQRYLLRNRFQIGE